MTPLGIIIIVTTILIAVTLHEAMHAFVGYWLGDDTAKQQGRLTLNPLAHLDPFGSLLLPLILAIAGLPIFGAAKPVPFNPNRVRYGDWGAAMVALAGPLTNLVLAILAGIGLRISGLTQDTVAGEIVILFTTVNIGFLVFNMIPFPPLDGSRVLYALAPQPVRDVMLRIESFGLVGVFLLLIFLQGPLGVFLGNSIIFLFKIFTGLDLVFE